MERLNFLWTMDDYTNNLGADGQYLNIAYTAFIYFCILWVVEYVSRFCWSSIDSKFTKEKRSIIILGRHTMDVFAMYWLVRAGFEALIGFGAGGFMGWNAMSGDIISKTTGQIATPGYQRAYEFSPAAQRLCVFQIAYECKNFTDSIIHNDGIIFLAHHFVTLVVSALATRPFLHLYSCFFLGWSEISTFFLCALVCFDDEHGIPGLNKAFPKTMTIMGVLFAISFTIIRVIIWPIINYYWWTDMLIIYNNGTVHSNAEWYLYMAISTGLTILQLIWFKDIVQGGIDMIKNGGEIVIKRGDSDSDHSDKKTTVKSTSKALKSPARKSVASKANVVEIEVEETEEDEAPVKKRVSRARAKSPAKPKVKARAPSPSPEKAVRPARRSSSRKRT